MDDTIRDFKREAPGRRRNSASTINAAAATIRGLEERSFTAPLLEFRGVSTTTFKLFHGSEGPLPPRLIEKVQNLLAHNELNAIGPFRFCVLITRRYERPVDEHRTPDDVVFGNESPVAAVQAHATMITHREVVIGRHYDV